MHLKSSVRFALSLGLLAGIFAQAQAETPSQIPNPRRTRRAWVADCAHVVDVATEAKLNAAISRLERRNGAEIAVVTVHNLGGLSVETFALQLFKRWKIGKKGINNGVLVLAAIDDRKARIEVGLGLESRISDATAATVLQDKILSQFRRDDYGGGLLAGVLALDQLISAPAPRPSGKSKSTVTRRVAASHAAVSRPFSAPSSSSAAPPALYTDASSRSSSGGGALWLMLLGGGGAVAAIAFVKSRPRRCPQCQGEMEELSAAQATQALTPVQQFEESLGSRDYHLWRCTRCGDQVVDFSNRLFSSYEDCRACGHRTASSDTQTESYATEFSSRRAIVTHTCQWPECGHIWQEERVLPRRSSSRSGSSSSHHHSSSSSSSSSGSSSSSSSSGGFGGGDSGGSGASGSW